MNYKIKFTLEKGDRIQYDIYRKFIENYLKTSSVLPTVRINTTNKILEQYITNSIEG